MKLGRARGFGAPLWWMTPPSEVVRAIVRESRAAVRWTGHGRSDALHRQDWLRKVWRESTRRLAAAHIFVEGGPNA